MNANILKEPKPVISKGFFLCKTRESYDCCCIVALACWKGTKHFCWLIATQGQLKTICLLGE